MNDAEVVGTDMEELLGAQGPLAEAMEGFYPRRGQIQMAQAVERTLRQGVPLLAEAGTGTGKTLAYLTPLVASGLKAVVSTGTKTLQDQISQKELPFLKEALDPDLNFSVLKGRSNYLCRRRYSEFASQPDLGLPRAQRGLDLLARWLEETENGDLDQIRGQGLSGPLAMEVTADGEQCLGGRCPMREDCFLVEARRRAMESRVLVVNHHLFLADLKLKADGFGEALPRYQAVVFDEAHLLPDVATQIFGISVSENRFKVLLRDLARDRASRRAVGDLVLEADAASGEFFGSLGPLAGPGGRAAGLAPDAMESLAAASSALEEILNRLAAKLGDADGEVAESLASRAMLLSLDLGALAKPAPGSTVAWVQKNRGGAALNLSPVQVGPSLDHALYQEEGRLVFTSATLAPSTDLAPAKERLGLPVDTHSLVVPSPFDLAGQSLLYVPKNMPAPASADFAEAVCRQVESLLKLSRGRAFVLFTTHRNLKLVSSRLRGVLPYRVLVQGEAPRMKLLQAFVEETPAVLFATAGFWQGVDVPGEALSAVIVDKLPFAPPDDPLVAARCRLLEEDGQSSFARLLVPEAILSLKQGLGRLLRTAEDRGVLAVLDSRLLTKGYGKRFLKALAPTPLTSNLDEVKGFFE